MIAPNKILLDNTFLVESAKSLKSGGFISGEEFTAIKFKYQTLKTHSNILVRIGFFILGCFLYSSISGVVSLLGFKAFETGNYEIMLFIFAAIGLAGAELFSHNNFYKHGLDDPFVLGFQGFLCCAVGVVTESSLAVFIAMALIGFICCVRYVNSLSLLISLIGITGTISVLILDYHIINQMFLSFVLFFVAVALYFGYLRLNANPKIRLYKNALRLMQVYALFLGYASVNYFVVREVSQELMKLILQKGEDIPLAFIFYGLTFLVPIFYILFSLKKKNRDMFLIGLTTLALSFATIRYYYRLMPIELALLFGGAILFALTYFAIRFLKNNESGITFKPDRYTNSNALLYAQVILANSQVNLKAEHDSGDMPFGGGGFSGGGSTASY